MYSLFEMHGGRGGHLCPPGFFAPFILLKTPSKDSDSRFASAWAGLAAPPTALPTIPPTTAPTEPWSRPDAKPVIEHTRCRPSQERTGAAGAIPATTPAHIGE